MKYNYWQAALWVAVYVVLALTPLSLMLIGPLPEGRGFWMEFGVALGFLGFTMLALQFAFTGRYRGFASGFGSDNILQFHLATGVAAVLMILSHPLVILITKPSFLTFLDPRDEILRALALWAVIGAVTLVLVLSLWRNRFRLAYEWWRVSHGLLAAFVVLVGLAHLIQVAWFTDPWWKRGVMIGVAGSAVLLLAHTRLGKPWILKRHPYVVTDVREGRADAWTLVVEPVGHVGMSFAAGQYAWLTLGETPFRLQQHPFSIASSADEPRRLQFTAKVAGDFTATLPEVKSGTRVFIAGPHGAFTLRADASRGCVFVAGGIGITPVMSILRTLADRGDLRPCLLLYANNAWKDVVFRDEIAELEERIHLRVVHVLTEAPAGWEGETGYIDGDVLDRHLPRPFDALYYYICGPEPLMNMVEKALVERGVARRMILSERFAIV